MTTERASKRQLRQLRQIIFSFFQNEGMLCVTAVAGIMMGILDFLGLLKPIATGAHSKSVDPPADFCLVLLGVLMAGIWVERRKITEQFACVTSGLALLGHYYNVPSEKHAQIAAYGKSVERFHQLTLEEGEDASFTEIADDLMADLGEQVESIGKGQINVRIENSPYVLQRALTCMRDRFDAVSDQDLDFWVSPLGRDYMEQIRNVRINTNRTMKATRMLIVKQADLDRRHADLIKILLEHHQSGIGFGLIVEEGMPDPLKQEIIRNQLHLDFALFNSHQALELFEGNPRRMRLLFSTRQHSVNNDAIQSQLKLLSQLVPECYLVNRLFADDIQLLFNATWESIKRQAEVFNSELRRKYQNEMPINEGVFPFVLENDEQLPQLNQLFGYIYQANTSDAKYIVTRPPLQVRG